MGRRTSVICVLVLAGCGSASSSTIPADSRSAPDAGRPAQGRLAVSAVSNGVVQPQPRPGSCHARGSGRQSLPDAGCTPGAISPAVTQSNIDSTICRRGYTRVVRPPERISEIEKRQSMAAYGDTGSASAYQYDHLVPLELGGASNDPRNLWPEPGRTPNPKDELERRLNRLVCQRRLALARAQLEIARDWVAADRGR